MRVLWALILGCSLLGTVARAQTDLFEAAVAEWLRGSDETSLPVLAELARDGQADARILLAQIEISNRSLSPFMRDLPRDERRALFRHVTRAAPLGQSWLAVEAEDGNAVAAALLRARAAEVAPDLIYTLIAAGEAQASDRPTRFLALHGTDEERAALRDSPSLLPELQPYLDYLLDTAEPRGDGLAALRHIAAEPQISADSEGAIGMAGLLALGFHYGDLNAGNPWRETVENWLLTAPATQPLADLCATCDGGQGACAFALMALIGGYFEVIRLDSPYEAVIAQSEFLGSPRARLTALRRAALTRSETDEQLASIPQIAGVSQCAADLVADIRAQ